MSGRAVISGDLQRVVMAELRRRVPARGHAKRAAAEAGVSLSTVYDVLAKRREPSLRLAIALGLVRLAAGEAVPSAAEADETWRKDQLELPIARTG
jgi:hypothetical protein